MQKKQSLFCKIQRIFSQPKQADNNAFLKMQQCQPIIRQGSPMCFESFPLKVHWQITESCNYRCTYCFDANSGYSSTSCNLEQAEATIRHLASANRSSYQISLLGGEPTLHPHLADIISLLGLSLGKRLERISIITNGSFNSKTIDAINDVAQLTNIEIKISVHFEYANIEQLTSLLGKFSDEVFITFLVMLHPGLFEKGKQLVDELCNLRKQHAFNMSINFLREPPSFTQLDHHYTDEIFSWTEEAVNRFNDVASASCVEGNTLSNDPGFEFILEKEVDTKLIKYYGLTPNELGQLTSFNFSGMVCCAGLSVIHIDADGKARGMVCKLGGQTCNIFEQNPFMNEDWIYLVECTKSRCGCDIDYRIPKYRDIKQAQTFISVYQQKQEACYEVMT